MPSTAALSAAALAASIAEHLRVAHIDAGLHDQRDDAVHRCAGAAPGKSRLVQIVGPRAASGRVTASASSVCSLAAGDRHFRADDIDEVAPPRAFGDGAELGGALGDRRFGQARVVGAGHAGVEMDLVEARLDKAAPCRAPRAIAWPPAGSSRGWGRDGRRRG